jgi:hypothetical protein
MIIITTPVSQARPDRAYRQAGKKIKANSFATFSLEKKGGAKSSSRF